MLVSFLKSTIISLFFIFFWCNRYESKIPLDEVKKIMKNARSFSFKAKIIDVHQDHRADRMTQYIYNFEEFKQRKTYWTIIAGSDACFLVKMILTDVYEKESTFHANDTIDFIVHSPAKLLIHRDSLPQYSSFELIVKFIDNTNILLTLYPKL